MKEGLDNPRRVVSIAAIAGPDRHRGRAAGADRRARDAREHRGRSGAPPRLPGSRRRGRRRRHAADPQHGDARRQPRQRPRCWYYRLAEFDCRKKGGERVLRPRRREPLPRDLRHRRSAAASTPPPRGRRSWPTARRSTVVGAKGRRALPIEEFFVGPTTTPRARTRSAPGRSSRPSRSRARAGRALGLQEAQGEGVLRLAARRGLRRLAIDGGNDPGRARRARLRRADSAPREGGRDGLVGGAPSRGALRARRRGGGRGREASLAERVQGAARQGGARARAPGGVGLPRRDRRISRTDDPLAPMRRFAKPAPGARRAGPAPLPAPAHEDLVAPDAFGQGDPRRLRRPRSTGA